MYLLLGDLSFTIIPKPLHLASHTVAGFDRGDTVVVGGGITASLTFITNRKFQTVSYTLR